MGDGEIYSFNLDAAHSRILGFRPPVSAEPMGPDARREYRFDALVRAYEYVLALVELFGALRRGPNWFATEQVINAWLEERANTSR
jgi:hypothetical protein